MNISLNNLLSFSDQVSKPCHVGEYKMKVWGLVVLGLILVSQVSAVGGNCGANTYFGNPSMTVSATPAKGTTSTFTLTGTTPVAMGLREWDIYVNFNGAINQQYDVTLSGNYTAGQTVTVTYALVNSASAQSGYYNMRFLLQNSQGYYINCWQYAFSLVG
jgi:hypothetical protein